METLGGGALLIVLTLIVREGLPALGKFLDGKGARERQAHEDAAKTESVIVTELKELVAALKQNGIEDRQQIHDLRNDVNTCQIDRAVLSEQVASLQEALDKAGIPYRKRTKDGSGAHQPLLPKEAPRE